MKKIVSLFFIFSGLILLNSCQNEPEEVQNYTYPTDNVDTKDNSFESKSEKKIGIEFLEKNKKRKEVKTTESGLQYEILKEGNGPKPSVSSVVKVHYTGTLIDGTKFDSSVDRGEPIEFSLNQVIAGWTEGLQLMPIGSKFKFYIPSELAYGDNPRPGGPIKPGSTLIFDVELLDFKK